MIPTGGNQIDILMVEDSPGDARLAVEALREGRVQSEVTVVTDGVEALAYLHRRGRYANAPRPDLVLLDLNLPRKSGQEVLAEVKQDPALRSIPIVILTTSPDEADVVRAYDNFANCYITKPVDLDQFLNVVRTIESFWLTIVRLS